MKAPFRPAPPRPDQPRPVSSRPLPAGARLAEVEEIELVVEKLVAGGEGLARHDGVPIFVPRSAPGDRLRVRIVERRPDYGRAEIVEILSDGPGRREPPCPHFARCGGCDLQHLEDDLQSRLKVGAARETLERLGRLTLPRTELLTGASWGYRLRTQVHVGDTVRGPAVGYLARRSHELVPISRCPVLVPELEMQLMTLARELPSPAPRRLDLAVGGDGTLTAAPTLPGILSGEVEIEVDGIRYGYDARAFFQAHRGLLGTLVATAVGSWEGETVCDLYSGVGLFSLPLARRYRRVIAIEGDRLAARFARNNARRNRLPNVEVVAQAVETWMPELPEGIDRVIVDPPRAGLGRTVRQALLARPARRLTYVSCHAATLARDLAELAPAYELESVTFLDLFPQTGHLETIVQLVGVRPAATEDAGTPVV